MEFLQDNLILQIIMGVAGLALIGVCGYRAIKGRVDKSKTKRK